MNDQQFEKAKKICQENECETCPVTIPIAGGKKACRAFKPTPIKNLEYLTGG